MAEGFLQQFGGKKTMSALENEMLLKIQKKGLNVIPKILIVTRLIPDAKGATRNQRPERISGTEHTHFLSAI